MKLIKKYVHKISDELCGAQEYAEKYVEYTAEGDTNLATKFKEMANDELNHAMIIHDIAVKKVEMLSKVFKAPPEMKQKWDECHSDYVQRMNWVKQLLNM